MSEADRDHLEARWPLDRAVGRLRTRPGPWVLAAVGPLGGLAVAVGLVASLVAAVGLPHSADARALYGLVGESVFGVSAVACSVPLARRYGGWRPALGLTAPAEGQGRTILRWVGVQFAARIAVATALVAAVPGLRHGRLGNLTGVADLHAAGVACLLVGAVGVAPVVEELAFRGAMLRGLMRRMRFWVAAPVTAVVFGALHSISVNSWAAVAFTVPSIALFGLIQCMLVRRTGELGPAIGVHAATNLIALALALLSAQSG